MKFWKYLELGSLRPPELICFDHLYSEYLAMKLRIKDDSAVKFIEELLVKVKSEDAEGEDEKESWRGKGIRPKANHLSWNELYYFELILADHLPVEKLRSKIIRMRSDFRSVASGQEYSEYMGSKPPDLQSPPVPPDPKEQQSTSADEAAHYEKLLREDLKDLLGRMYMKYAVLPVREKRLTDLTLFAARLCLISLIALLGIILIVFLVPLFSEVSTQDTWAKKVTAFVNSPSLSSLTVFVVVVSGAMGGFVSALQRIQSPPSEGDSLYNLSLLFHGSKSVFVAPITGSIFAILLYLMFAAGILQGTFFPDIFTPGSKYDPAWRVARNAANTSNARNQQQPAQPSNKSANANESSAVPLADVNTNANAARQPANGNINSNSGDTNSDGIKKEEVPPNNDTHEAKKDENNSASSKKQDSETDSREPTKGLNVFDFLARSGPGTGKDYALLIIWCFIAGFAERFVPDALDRLISNSKSNGKK